MERKVFGLLVLLALFAACGTESSTSGTENPLGMLIECDEVIDEVIGYVPPNPEDEVVRRYRAAYVPVADPLSVTVTRCGIYIGQNGEWEEPSYGVGGVDCIVSDEVTFTPDFGAYVECQEEDIFPDGTGTGYGARRVYLRENPTRTVPSSDTPLGVPVDCDERLITMVG